MALGGLLAGGAGAGGGEHVAAQLVAEAQDLRDGQPLLEAGELEHPPVDAGGLGVVAAGVRVAGVGVD